MSEKLTVAELMARNAKDGGRTRADRPRRRRNFEDGGVSVSELTGSIPVVRGEDLDVEADGAGAAGASGESGTADTVNRADSSAHAGVDRERPGGHQLDDRHVRTDSTDSADRTSVIPRVSPAVSERPAVVEPADDPAVTAGDGPGYGTDPQPEPVPVADTRHDDVASAAAVSGRPEVADTAEGPESDADDDAADDDAADADAAADDDAADAADDDTAVDDTADADDAGADEIIEYEDDAISWPALLGQSAVALVVGIVIFFGFTLLWDNLGPPLVLIMAVAVTLVCVGVVHALLRHRHALVLILAFIVGLVITIGPRLVMSI